MKLKYRQVLDDLQNLINYRPKHADLSKILGDVSAGALSNRLSNDGFLTTEELAKIEDYYAIKLIGGGSADTVQIDFYPDVFGSCGSGAMVFDESSEKLSVTKDIITNYSASNQYSIIVARGRSNEPTIMNEDKLVVEHVKDNAIIDNQLYVFSYEGQIYVKRLIKNIDELVIISDNPDKEVYRTQYVAKNNINNVNIIGKIVGLIRDKV